MALSGFFQKLKTGLSRSAERLGSNISAAFTKRKLDEEALEELEDMLIGADLGTDVARRVIGEFRRTRFGKEVTDAEIRETLAADIATILAPVALPLVPEKNKKPFVILMTGVNGAGKTTTIGKLASLYREQGLSVMLAAGDTFRAAAVEQLQVWGQRAGAEVVSAPANTDAASLAHDALARARKAGVDVLLIDTAGRLHNKTVLMEELRKIIRVIRKLDESAPHAVLLTLDATTGQNAVAQVRIFKEMVDLTGLVVTKLDGSARGGIVVALADAFGLPVHAVGTGEQAGDLRPFDATEFARALVGL
jgi:fused signal recognition particle receptor